MNETVLQNLLKQADQQLALSPHADPAALAGRAIRRAARQSRRQTALLTAVVCLLVLTVGLAGYSRRQHLRRLAFESQMQTELARIKAEARETLALIQQANAQLELEKKNAELQSLLASIEARALQIETRSEALAATLYEKARTLAADEATCPIAETLYQRIVQTFPETSYGPLARQALVQFESPTTPQS